MEFFSGHIAPVPETVVGSFFIQHAAAADVEAQRRAMHWMVQGDGDTAAHEVLQMLNRWKLEQSQEAATRQIYTTTKKFEHKILNPFIKNHIDKNHKKSRQMTAEPAQKFAFAIQPVQPDATVHIERAKVLAAYQWPQRCIHQLPATERT